MSKQHEPRDPAELRPDAQPAEPYDPPKVQSVKLTDEAAESLT